MNLFPLCGKTLFPLNLFTALKLNVRDNLFQYVLIMSDWIWGWKFFIIELEAEKIVFMSNWNRYWKKYLNWSGKIFIIKIIPEGNNKKGVTRNPERGTLNRVLGCWANSHPVLAKGQGRTKPLPFFGFWLLYTDYLLAYHAKRWKQNTIILTRYATSTSHKR